MLNKTHAYYAQRGFGRIEKNPETWVYCRAADYDRLPGHMVARTKSGQYLVRHSSDVDYSGNFLTRSVAFDCKQFSGTSVPLGNFREHQVDKMCASEISLGLSGFLVYAVDAGMIYWVKGSTIRKAQDNIRFQRGRGKHPKSLNIRWFEENAIVITDRAIPGGMVDWAKVLINSQVQP